MSGRFDQRTGLRLEITRLAVEAGLDEETVGPVIGAAEALLQWVDDAGPDEDGQGGQDVLDPVLAMRWALVREVARRLGHGEDPAWDQKAEILSLMASLPRHEYSRDHADEGVRTWEAIDHVLAEVLGNGGWAR